MNVEESRLRTFEDWPRNTAVDPNRIAAAGFYCIGRLRVKCFSCGVEITDWQFGDQVMSRHRAMSPECAFVRDPERAGNVPLIVVQPTSHQNGRENPREPEASIGRWVSESTIYKSEQTRLESFAEWPISFIVQPEALAASGFYFLRQGDKVCCAFCTGVINRWEGGDSPHVEHRRHFPSCPFLLGLPVGNIPRVPGSNSAIRFAELGIQPHRGPRHSKFSTVEARFKTFIKWPSSAVQKPTDLAQAGFFYEAEDTTSGSAQDQVRCFHCDGGLRNWEPVDTPWQEHARWFPRCPFLLLVKGKRFVDDVQNQFKDGVPVVSVSHLPSTSDPAKLPVPKGPSGLSSSMPSLSETERPSEGTSACAPGTTEALEEENRRLRDARQCKICMDAEIGTVLLPCGHLVACVGCAPSLLDCPVCRVTIKAKSPRAFIDGSEEDQHTEDS